MPDVRLYLLLAVLISGLTSTTQQDPSSSTIVPNGHSPALDPHSPPGVGHAAAVPNGTQGVAHNSSDSGGHGNSSAGHGANAGAHGERHDGVHVASWNFPYVAGPLVISVFILAVGILKLMYHYAECLANFIPESCLLIIFGIGMGAILQYGITPNSDTTSISAADFTLEPKMFMLFLLPPIVLDSAYSLNDRVFADNIGTILLYAVVGTILNCFMIGPLLFGFCYSGVLGEITISFVQCLLFASFIVAVDPVAVLAIFQEVGVNNVLYFLVFGESLLNDAVTVVLYNMMKAFNGMDVVPIEQILLGVASFFTVSLGGLSIGIIFGVLTALLTRATTITRIVEPIAILSMAYLSYICAELFHWSGIISMIGCGIMQAQYSFHNISERSLTTVNYFVKMLSSLSDAVIFLFLGLEVMRTAHKWHTGFVLCALVLCLLCRLVTVFGLTWLCNRHGRVKIISMEEQFIMWYGGLRGAVCFALCATLDESFVHRNLFLTTTLVIVFFTVFVQGITIKPLVGLLNITRKHDETHSLAVEFQTNVSVHVTAGVEVIIGNQGGNDLKDWLNRINEQYLRYWLQNNPKTREEQFLEMYQKIAIKDHVNHIYEATSTVVKTNEIEDDDDDLPILPMDDPPQDSNKLRRRTVQTDKNLGLEELVNVLGNSYNQNFAKNIDRDLTGKSNDIVAKLKQKHARLKENKHLRSPPSSPRGNRSRVQSTSEQDDEHQGGKRRDSESSVQRGSDHRRPSDPPPPWSDSHRSSGRRQSAPHASYGATDPRHPLPILETSGEMEAAAAPPRSGSGQTNGAFEGDAPGQHTTVIAITNDPYSSSVEVDGTTHTKC